MIVNDINTIEGPFGVRLDNAMKPNRQKIDKAVILYIGDPGREGESRRQVSLTKSVVERGRFTEKEADVALGRFTFEECRLWKIKVDPHIREKVAVWLMEELKKLREGERQIGTAPVLSGKAMSRLEIADLAMTMLEGSEQKPGEYLLNLLRQLLDVDRHREAFTEFPSEKFDLAVMIEAKQTLEGKAPSAYKLSRRLSVSPTTIIAWRRLPEYQLKLQVQSLVYREMLREFLEEIEINENDIPEQQAFQRAFEMYKKEWDKRDNPQFYFLVKNMLGSATDAQTLELVWESEFAPFLKGLTSADRKAVLNLLRKNKERLAR